MKRARQEDVQIAINPPEETAVIAALGKLPSFNLDNRDAVLRLVGDEYAHSLVVLLPPSV
jgi:hypothetical protein